MEKSKPEDFDAYIDNSRTTSALASIWLCIKAKMDQVNMDGD